jgi:hypothetical protein
VCHGKTSCLASDDANRVRTTDRQLEVEQELHYSPKFHRPSSVSEGARGGAAEHYSLRSGFGYRPSAGQLISDCDAVVERNEERIRVTKPTMFYLLLDVSNL